MYYFVTEVCHVDHLLYHRMGFSIRSPTPVGVEKSLTLV